MEKEKEKLEELKSRALSDFARYVNPQKVRVLKNAGLDIIEARREGSFVWDTPGRSTSTASPRQDPLMWAGETLR